MDNSQLDPIKTLGKILSVKYNYSNIRVAVVGCGNWGKNLIRAFSELGALCAVCDIEPSKAMVFSEKYAIPYIPFETLLSAPNIDAIVIAAPSYTHEELAVLSLKAKKHVYIEKPLALTTQSAMMLSQLAQQQGRILMVGHLLQYHAAFNTLKAYNNEKILGNLQHLYSYRFNFGKYPSEKSVLWDYAPHDVSMILSLVKTMPYQVTASGGNHLQHTALDSICFHLHFHPNIQAHIFVSWLHPVKEQKLTVVGDKAMMVFEDSQPWESKLKLYRYPDRWNDGLPQPFPSEPESIAVPPSEPLLNECQHFLDSIIQNTQPITDGLEGTQVTTILEAAMTSWKTQEPVHLSATPLFYKTEKEVIQPTTAEI